MTKYIFVTGGVVSSLGKGITAASLARLLKSRGLRIDMLKFDPYFNVDPGTMNPYQHGEVYVTEDGAETDLDLGHYERYLDQDMGRKNNCTAGQIYDNVISRERRGEFLGKTVQVIPHITNEIKSHITALGGPTKDIVITEVGGTVGDIESLPFLEAIRQMRLDVGRDNVLYIHVTLVPYIRSSEEMKTKPTQHSVGKLREIGIEPDIIVCRTERPLDEDIRAKISLFCSVPVDAVIEARDVPTIYEVPLAFEREGMDELALMQLRQRSHRQGMEEWAQMVDKIKTPRKRVTVALAGKYVELKDAYKSVNEALMHGGIVNDCRVHIKYIDVETPDLERELAEVQGILVPGGFGDRGIEGKISVVRYAREHNVPYLGLCLGMQCAVIEYARNVCGMKTANSTEFNAKTSHPVIDVMAEQKSVHRKGGTMRLGVYPCRVKPGSLAATLYGKPQIDERHRHRYEFNPKYRKALETKGLRVSGEYTERRLAEIVELPTHPFFIAVQFHPEFKSRPTRPHPLFRGFIAASLEFKSQPSRKHRPFKFPSKRPMRNKGFSVSVDGIQISNERPLVLIAGPCVIESSNHAVGLAKRLAQLAREKRIPYIFKASYDKANRSSITSFRGPGLHKGLDVLRRVKAEVGCPVLTDVHSVAEARLVAEVADVLQIPAFLCRQTDLLLACGETGKVVNIKKGQFLAPWDMEQAIGKVVSTGNRKILLTERGTSFGYNNLVVDMRSLAVMKQFGYPVIYDATHSVQLPGALKKSSGGQREFVEPLARAAVALGVAGLFCEVHENPSVALSDGPNSLAYKTMPGFLKTVLTLDKVAKTL